MGPLLRIGAWGLAAAGALAFAVFASRSEIGERRFALALADRPQSDTARQVTAQALTRAAQAEREARRLAEKVQTLTGDRDQLANRVATLERSLEDLTGSISLTRPARRPAMVDMLLPPLDGPSTPPAASDPPTPGPPALREIASLPSPSAAPTFPDARAPQPAPMALGPAEPAAADPDHDESVPFYIPVPRPNPLAADPLHPPATRPATPMAPTRDTTARNTAARDTAVHNTAARDTATLAQPRTAQRMGLDLGGATSVEGLRALWTHIKKSPSSPLIADLKPLVSVRDAAQPGSVELRLVAGPVPSALAASRLCAALSASGTACRTAAFEGQTLTSR